MGEGYLTEGTKLGRKVAIKLLPAETTQHRTARRLLREARSASAINHPKIVTIYSIEEAEGVDFIVMEYVEGDTLKSRIELGPLSPQELLDLGAQIGHALTSAHAAGLIHHDIKPANILITPRGQAKVMDFGLAKVARQGVTIDSEAETQSLLTAPGVIVGTMPYMSPEQKEPDPQCCLRAEPVPSLPVTHRHRYPGCSHASDADTSL